MIMRDFTGNVVQNMGFRDTVGCVGSDPTHYASKISKKITVQGREGTSGKGEFLCTIVRKKRVGVLQKGNKHEPVIYPKIRHQISSEYCKETPLIDAKGDTGKPKKYPESRDQDLAVVMGGKHRRRGIEVYKKPTLKYKSP